MFYMSEREFREKKRKARLKNESIYRKQELKKIKNMYKPQKKKIQTSKIFFLMIFLSCFSTQVFAMVSMWHFGNLDQLGTLIGATLSEGMCLVAYFCKSFLESKEEHKLEFEREKFYTDQSICSEDNGVG